MYIYFMRISGIIACLFFWFNVLSQQTPAYTLDILNINKLTPAFAGVSDQLNIFGIYRSQWQAHEGSPSQFTINASLPFYKWQGGLGIDLSSTNQGATSQTEINLSYSYHTTWLSDILAIGATVGLGQVGIDSERLVTPDGSYTTGVNHNDPILSSARTTQLFPVYGLSLFYGANSFDAGLNLKNIGAQKINIDENIDFTISRQISAFFMYYWTLPNEWIFQPSAHLFTNFNQIQIEITNLLKYGNVFGGLGMRGYDSRSIESFSLLGGIKFNEAYTISYNFDVSVNKLRRTSEGSHEIMFRYNLNREINTGRPPKTIHNPRNL